MAPRYRTSSKLRTGYRPEAVRETRKQFTENDFIKRGLPANHGVEMVVSRDGRCAWLWRRTISGWILGIAVAAQNGSFLEWLYAGPSEPVQSPIADGSTWGKAWDVPPDWRTA